MINIKALYGPQVGSVTAEWPTGEPIDNPTPGLGTPWAAPVYKDMLGFQLALLERTSQTANGVAETATASQAADAVEKIASDGDSQLAGGTIWPVSSQEVAQAGDDLTGFSFVRLSGGDFSELTQFPIIKKDGTKTPLSGNLSNINLTTRPYSATVGADDVWLLDIRAYTAVESALNVMALWAKGNANFRSGVDSWYEDSSFTIPANDDTASFQAALDTGMSIYAPNANYLLTGSGVSVNTNGQSLFGDGVNTRFRFNEESGTAISCGVENTTLHDFLVSHGRATNTNTNVGVDFGQFTSPQAYNLFVSSMGVGVIGGAETFLDVAIIENARQAAIKIVRGQKHNMSNIFVSTCTAGILVDGVSTGSGVIINLSDIVMTTISGIGSNPTGYALDLFETRTVNISNVNVRDCGIQAVRVSGSGSIKNKYVNITNFNILDACNETVNAVDAIEIDYCEHVQISNMVLGFETAGVTPRDAINFGSNVDYAKVSNSDLADVNRSSIGGATANDVLVSNSRIRQIDSAGTYSDVIEKTTAAFGIRKYSGAGSISPQWSQGAAYRIQATSDVTINAFSAPEGAIVTFIIVQDNGGGWNVTWNSAFKNSWSNSGNADGSRSTIQFIRDEAGSWTQIGQQSNYI